MVGILRQKGPDQVSVLVLMDSITTRKFHNFFVLYFPYLTGFGVRTKCSVAM